MQDIRNSIHLIIERRRQRQASGVSRPRIRRTRTAIARPNVNAETNGTPPQIVVNPTRTSENENRVRALREPTHTEEGVGVPRRGIALSVMAACVYCRQQRSRNGNAFNQN